MKIRKIISLLLAMMMALSFNVVTYASGIVIEEDDNSVSGGPVHRAVSYVQISGPESTSVQKVSICYPNFPAHCE